MKSIILAGASALLVVAGKAETAKAEVSILVEEVLMTADRVGSQMLFGDQSLTGPDPVFGDIGISIRSDASGPLSNVISGIITGDNNALTINQGGAYNTINFIQSGNGNAAHIQQTGHSGRIVFKQVGSGNIVQISQ